MRQQRASSGRPAQPEPVGPPGTDYGDDTPQHKESGEFFLARYRAIEPEITLIDGKSVRQALRVNTSKVSVHDLAQEMTSRGAALERIPFLRNGLFATAAYSLGATPEYLLGYYYLQAPLSQLVCEVLDPHLGATVLDMASAPGGKTTYLATMVGDTGRVIALDNDTSRLASVRNNAERLGVANVLCVKKDARFASDFGALFSHVLLDAPCSGNYCSDEEWFGKRRIEDIRENARTQRELIKAAVVCLAPGGRLVYSTCSLEPEEDELVIDWLLKRFPELDIIALNSIPIGDSGAMSWDGQVLDPRVAGTRRFWPHKTGMEGFFIALLQKRKD
jgi:NOL1/NOP2/sun family putative RNA methylase